MQKKVEVDLNYKDIEDIKKMIATKITIRRIEGTLKEVIKEKLTDELINSIIERATEKAIKDIAKWKMTRDILNLDVKVERIWKTLEKKGITIENYER